MTTISALQLRLKRQIYDRMLVNININIGNHNKDISSYLLFNLMGQLSGFNGILVKVMSSHLKIVSSYHIKSNIITSLKFMNRNKKTPMFESAMPSAYDFVDFTSPEQQSSLSKFGRDLKSSGIVNESINNSDKVFFNIEKEANQVANHLQQKTETKTAQHFNFSKPKDQPKKQELYKVSENGPPFPIQNLQGQRNNLPAHPVQSSYSQQISTQQYQSKQYQMKSTMNKESFPEQASDKTPSYQNNFQKGIVPKLSNFQPLKNIEQFKPQYQRPMYDKINSKFPSNQPQMIAESQVQNQPPNYKKNVSPIYSPNENIKQMTAIKKREPMKGTDINDKIGTNNSMYKNDEKKSTDYMIQSTPGPTAYTPTTQSSGFTDESFLDLLPEPSRSNLKALLQRSKTQNNP